MSIEEIKNDKAFIHTCKVNNLDPDRVYTSRNVIWVPTNKRGYVAYMDYNYQIKDVDIDIATNPIFLEKTRALGLDPTDFYLFENVIALATPKKNYYCFMDRKFNIFWISKYSENRLESTSEYLYRAYISSVAFEEDSWTFPRPFSKLSYAMIMNLAYRIDGINSKDFHLHDKRKIFVCINRELYTAQKDDIYGALLCFIKYLSIASEFYFEKLYPLILGGVVDEPNIVSPGAYLISLINGLFSKTKESLERNQEIDYRQIISSFGQHELNNKVESIMPAIINLLKRYHEGEVTIDTLETIVDSITTILGQEDKPWRPKEGIIYPCQKSLEELFDSKESKKKIELHPKE